MPGVLPAPIGGERLQLFERTVARILNKLRTGNAIGTRSDNARRRMLAKHRELVFEPTCGDYGVVVEEQNKIALGQGQRLIIAGGETAIDGIADQPRVRLCSGILLQPFARLFTGSIVHQQQLIRLRREQLDALQTTLRVIELVVDQNDDGDEFAIGC